MSLKIFQLTYIVKETEWKGITSFYVVWWVHFFVFNAENVKKYALFQVLVNPITLMGIGKPAFKEIQG